MSSLPKQPNILLITSDQLRSDCLSIEDHPDVITPNLDKLGTSGARFQQAYTPAPICSPARRSILTGHSPATDGALDNAKVRIPLPEDTLPNLLRKAGYQTAEIGRSMHQHPQHARYGFEIRQNNPFQSFDSHVHYSIRQTSHTGEFDNWPHLLNHGLPLCGWGARPWPYDEAFHQSTWAVNKAIEFLDNRDQDVPFFVHVGFVAPHPPLIPPQCYFDRYINRDLTKPVVGTWADLPPCNARGLGPGSGFIPLGGHEIQETMAGYYGLVHHMDAVLFNLLIRYQYYEAGPTYVLFCSDHGEMLGDHHMFRKSRPYQGSVHVPFMLAGPDIDPGTSIEEPITLEDILPTICDIAGVNVPSHVEGKSVMPLLSGGVTEWRPYVHSESPDKGEWIPAFHALCDGKWKYIWFSGSGREQLFDLKADPRETKDLSTEPLYAENLQRWQQRLVDHLADRPEGFSENGTLKPGRPHASTLPHAVPV